MNYGTTIAQFALEAYYGTHTYFRFRKSDSTWTSWQTHETTDGAQARATTALNSAKAYTDAHEAKLIFTLLWMTKLDGVVHQVPGTQSHLLMELHNTPLTLSNSQV